MDTQTRELDRSPDYTGATVSTLHELQTDTLPLMTPVLLAAGLALLASAGRFAEPLVAGVSGTMLLVLAGVVYALCQRSYLTAAWLASLGCLAVTLFIVAESGLPVTACLLALPVGLATTFVSTLAGGTLAAGVTLALLLIPGSFPLDPILQAVAIAGIWGTAGLVWLTQRPFATAMRWYWMNYEQNRALLEEARDAQVQLKQTIEDLADANLQLTRLNRLAQSLRQAAEHARRAKEEFVANVSHELRTPLNMVIGFSQMILEASDVYGAELPQNLLADLDVIHRNSQHLSKLIDDVLDLSQIEAGHVALVRERARLHDIIEAAATGVRPLFESKRLRLAVEVADDLPVVLCDPTRIRQVVLNLLSNAGRFTEHGEVRLRARQSDGSITVSVADTGPGIAAEAATRVFSPFEQVDGSIRRRFGGSGLGLPISKHFVELHGGRIWFESEEGQGSTFYFTLPIDPPADDEGVARWFSPYQQYEERARPTRAPAPVVRPRFLVLETGGALQRLLTRYLSDAEITRVDTLQDAVRELARTPAQALLMNDLSVSQALEQLSESGGMPDGTPALVCSVPGIHEAAATLGVTDYLVKPIMREALLSALDRLEPPVQTLLVIDDEPDALRLFRRLLLGSGRGYRILKASDGQEALDILHAHPVDAILLDLVMPTMDGFQFLAHKSQDVALREIPTIAISARDPGGQPIVSNALAVERAGGISLPQLVACIEALSQILSPGGPTHAPASAGTSSD